MASGHEVRGFYLDSGQEHHLAKVWLGDSLGDMGDDTLLRNRGPSPGSNSCAAFAPPSRATARWLYSYVASPLHSSVCNRLVLFA